MLENFPIDWSPTIVFISIGSILFNPLFWNLVARNEYHNKTITKSLGNQPRLGCYCLAATIFSLGLLRDYLYKLALESQPISVALQNPFFKPLTAGLVLFGNILVLSSTYKLGIVGTFLGDYFGILMDAPVTSFPFNIVENPMYVGSTLIFLGTGIWYEKALGLVLTVWVHVVYYFATQYENPFTTMIYANRENTKQGGKKLN